MKTTLSDNSISVLIRSGWYPGRDVSTQLDLWTEQLGSYGFKVFREAKVLLAEFGGIIIVQNASPPFFGTLPVVLDPTVAIYDAETGRMAKELFDYFTEKLGEDLYPIGQLPDSQYDLAVSEDGKVFAILDDMQLVGMNFDEAVSNLARGYIPNDLNFY